MTRKSIKGIFAKSMSDKAAPVEENKNLPLMEDAAKVKARPPILKKGDMVMDNAKQIVPTKAHITSGKAMQQFATVKPLALGHQQELPDQVKKKTSRSTAAADSYVVFRMHVQNGEMSVVGSKKVEGKLVQHEDIVQSGLTYETMLNEERLSIGSVADYGEQRSFARPGGEPGQHVHHITILPSFDFNVKIPADKIALKDLPKLQISLYKFKEHVPDLKLNSRSLQAQFVKEVREVAVLKGIKVSSLNKEVKEMVTRSVKK